MYQKLRGEFELEEYSLLIGEKEFKVKLPKLEKRAFEADVNGKLIRVGLLDDVCFDMPVFLDIDGKLYKVELERTCANSFVTVKVDGVPYVVRFKNINRDDSKTPDSSLPVVKRVFSATQNSNKGVISASMPGKVALLRVKTGDSVNMGDVLLVLESMKMETEVVSPMAGTVKEVRISEGSAVNLGEVMVLIDET